MNRRKLFGLLAGLPFAGKALAEVKAERAPKKYKYKKIHLVCQENPRPVNGCLVYCDGRLVAFMPEKWQ